MTTTPVGSSSLLQQIQSLATSIDASTSGQTAAVSNFMKALETVLTAGEQILQANLTQGSTGTTGSTDTTATPTPSTAGSTSSSASASSSTGSSSSSASTSATDQATITSMLATAQSQPSVYTPTTAWSQASWNTSPYDPANNAASSGVSQTVNGVQIIPGATGWDPTNPALQGIYAGIQGTWDTEAGFAIPQQSSQSQSSSGPYGWSNSPYNAANNAAALGVSQTVNGVQVIPGAPGWDPNNPALASIYAGMQSTWTLLNSYAPSSSSS